MSLIIISGPTASGKSGLADLLYNVYPSRIINADSMQVYDELPLLTAQPADLKSDPNKYSLYGSIHYKDKCSLAKWLDLVVKEIDKTLKDGKIPILVGGTGLYIMSLLEGIIQIPEIDSSVRNKVMKLFEEIGKEGFYKILLSKDIKVKDKIHENDSSRMLRAMEVFEQTGKSITEFQNDREILCKHKYLHLSLFPDRDALYENCDARFEYMVSNGALEEVRNFLDRNNAPHPKYGVEFALGYTELKEYLIGNMGLDQAKESAKQATRNYAKRQLTWFRNQMPEKHRLYYRNISDIEESAFLLLDFFLSKAS